MAKISVIVPVYKVESYIQRCVDSILNQTYTDLEILLVDDGSPDTCGKICDEYAGKDSRVSAFHKVNGGLSDARNFGCQYATGEYIIFVDSDDYLELDIFQYLYNNIQKYQADMATCGVYDVYDDHTKTQESGGEFVCSGQKAFEYILKGVFIRGEIWNKLMKRELIQGLQFPKGKLYEDIFYTARLMQRVSKVCVGTKPKYYYIHRSESITGKPYRTQLHDIIEAYEENYTVVCDVFPELIELAECLRLWSRFIVLDKLLLEEDYRQYQDYGILKTYIRSNIKKIVKNRYFSLPRKCSGVILCISTKLYRKLVFYSVKKQTAIEG